MAGIHDGHRQRMKQRFLRSGLKSFEPHNVLEMLLMYSVPRRDTNELAHNLINKFGSLDKVLEADYESLAATDGISENSALHLKLVFETFAYYEAEKNRKGFVASTSKAAVDYSRALFVGETDEVVYLLCFDVKQKLINASEISRGDLLSAGISIRKLVETAALHKAQSVILTHNHPSGSAQPSADDIAVTLKIMKALAPLEIPLNDHIVVGTKTTISFAETGIIASLREKL